MCIPPRSMASLGGRADTAALTLLMYMTTTHLACVLQAMHLPQQQQLPAMGIACQGCHPAGVF
jgi:hypothetical protein